MFASFVEHGVYNYVLNNSPFDNDNRLEKIMIWVEKNRMFYSEKAPKKDAVPEDFSNANSKSSDSSRDSIKEKKDKSSKEKKLKRRKVQTKKGKNNRR